MKLFCFLNERQGKLWVLVDSIRSHIEQRNKTALSEEKLEVTNLEVSRGSCTEVCAVCDTKLFPSISSFLTLLDGCSC